ncbi:1-aminocyclopropane-1-carboxylate deaminase/D-cysteine desulfhydrase [Aggregatimonas sangjinii]|uniref:1-aminocyclopropane-1-carboxylate deaminase/D-cysteine desulfhydrase n=1 Tax=Aggregatimonas sangjinii TaxID=2583587 RepID=A0A5B7SP95_9FLAO|nr:pyridoxal-phosphate dependent enzyme [Aggregatimonas sangjinii]QCW98849.1 1-aminocyclopropane-1-carboxylate deaminase/D-cysteine desulfhydrase [Aggregatimonas sangjinii]
MISSNQQVLLPILAQKNVSLYLKREDLLHPFISGNKYRKLKYNLLAAQEGGYDTLLTFGGAYSNHIAATAFAGQENRLRTIGIIRGEELYQKWETNPTLKFAHQNGMQFKFVPRDVYRNKTDRQFLKALTSEFGSFYLLPEGGANLEAVQGCEEILNPEDARFQVLCSCVGTGGTLAGISNSAQAEQEVLGFPALKGDSRLPARQVLNQDIRKFAKKENWKLISGYDFGGYAKITTELVKFINSFKAETGIPLDPVYTGKMLFGIIDMVRKNRFQPGTAILAIHSGGLQGITGMNQKLKKKKLPLLDI